MSIYTIEEINEQIKLWKDALTAMSTSQSYPMPNGRSLTRADLSSIREHLEWLNNEKNKIVSGSGPRILQGVPRR